MMATGKQRGKRLSAFWLLLPTYAGLAVLFITLIRRGSMQLLEPAGYIADIQAKILWAALIFAAVVGTTLIGAFFFVVLRYREDKHRRYEPNWTVGKKLQLLAWGVPFLAIVVISYAVWITAHMVDPYQPISGSNPLTIQVVALRWKWLFIYPEQHIAAINSMVIPSNRPVALQLTADAPMNSFWVPRLSGQVYAMPGMITQLHIEADHPGVFAGSPAEISGDGFAGMDFTVRAVSTQDFTTWSATAAHATQSLSYATYAQLVQPSSYNAYAAYSVPDTNIFQFIVMQFMVPGLDPSTLAIKGTAI